MSDQTGLLNKAKRLTALARVKRANAAGVQADGQFSTALNKMTVQFPGLEAQLANRSVLTGAAVAIGAAPDLTRSPERLRAQINDVGRPTPQFVHSRSAELAALVSSLQETNDRAWRTWARAQVESLDVDPGLLQGPRGQAVQERLKTVNQAVGKPFSVAEYNYFKVVLGQAQDLIAELLDPMRPEEVIARIADARGSLTFADLTDEEIEVLRQSSADGRRVKLAIR